MLRTLPLLARAFRPVLIAPLAAAMLLAGALSGASAAISTQDAGTIIGTTGEVNLITLSGRPNPGDLLIFLSNVRLEPADDGLPQGSRLSLSAVLTTLNGIGFSTGGLTVTGPNGGSLLTAELAEVEARGSALLLAFDVTGSTVGSFDGGLILSLITQSPDVGLALAAGRSLLVSGVLFSAAGETPVVDPVPVPAAALLFLTGLAGLALSRRKA